MKRCEVIMCTNTMQYLSGSKPLIFVLPQKDGPPTFYKVDPDQMYIIRDVAEELKVFDDPSSSSQSVPM